MASKKADTVAISGAARYLVSGERGECSCDRPHEGIQTGA